MKIKRNIKGAAFALSAVMAIAFAPTVSEAALSVTTDVSVVQKVANESTATVLKNQVSTSANIVWTGVAGDFIHATPTVSNLILTLSNGAKWNKVVVPLLTGGNGVGVCTGKTTSVLTCPLAIGVTAATAVSVPVNTAGLFDISAVPAGGTVTVSVGVFNTSLGAFAANSVASTSLFNKVGLTSPVVTANTGGAIAQVRATPAFSQFAVGTIPASSTATGQVFTLKNNTTSQTIIATDVTFTMTGSFADVTAITPGSATTAWTINAAKTQATANLVSNLTGGTALTSTAMLPALTFSGTKVIPIQSYTMSVATKAGSSFVASNPLASAKILNITHDGLSGTLTTAATSSLNVFRIRDYAGVGGTITVSGLTYSATGVGTKFGPVTLATALPANGAVLLTWAKILADPAVAALGLPAASRATLTITAATTNGSITNQKTIAGTGTTSASFSNGANNMVQ